MSSLREFARYVLSIQLGDFRPPRDGFFYYRIGTTELQTQILLRDSEFQCELITASPSIDGTFIPEHSHPHVDSIDVFLGGELGPSRGLGLQLVAGARKRVPCGVLHGATIGRIGASILCIQQWRDGVAPTSIALDWSGPAHLEARYALHEP